MDRKALATRWWSCLAFWGRLVAPFIGRKVRCEIACRCLLEYPEDRGWEDHRTRRKEGRG